MSKIQTYIMTNCISYTVLILVYTLLAALDMVNLTVEAVFVLFAMTTCVAVAMFFTDKLAIKNRFLAILVDLGDIALVVFGINALLGTFPMGLETVAMMLVVMVIVYFAATGIFLLRTKADEEAINKQLGILDRKGKNGENH